MTRGINKKKYLQKKFIFYIFWRRSRENVWTFEKIYELFNKFFKKIVFFSFFTGILRPLRNAARVSSPPASPLLRHCHPYVRPHFSKYPKTKQLQVRIVIATGRTVCLVKWIIDGTHIYYWPTTPNGHRWSLLLIMRSVRLSLL